MKYLLLLFLILIAACARISIKSSDSANINIKDAYIRTTNIDYNEEKEINTTPTIGIIDPKNWDVLNETFSVKVNVTNFKLVPANWYPQQGQGYIQIWFDDMEFRSSETEFVFENESEGEHTIKAELMLSNHTVLPYHDAVRIVINKSVDTGPNFVPEVKENLQSNVKEFTVEADDNGFYPSTLKAKVRDKVTIHFNFRDASIYFAGLDIKGPFPDIKYRLKDEQPMTANFTMLEETKITSWWPSSGVKKATLTVQVEK